MSSRFHLIDGYNLLHAAGMARTRYGPGDLQRCRARLLKFLLTGLVPTEIARATVIFDARDPPPDRPAQLTLSGLRIQFANPGGDADLMIKQWLEDHSAPKRVTLVSSDHDLQRTARRRGAEFIDSDQFFDYLSRRRARTAPVRSPPAADPKSAGRLPAEQTEFWLKEFGNIVMPDETADDLATPGAGSPPAPLAPPRLRHGHRPRRRKDFRTAHEADRHANLSSSEIAEWLAFFGKAPSHPSDSPLAGQSAAELERWLANLDLT